MTTRSHDAEPEAPGRRARPRRVRAAAGALGALAVVLAASSASAQEAERIARTGSPGGAPACAQCHGETGAGNADAGIPRLSGLTSAYLAHQLASFADGSREGEIMRPIAAALDERERDALAAYYAGRPAAKPEGGEAAEPALVARGRALAEIGRWSRGLPGCGQCHGPAGQGVGTAFPPLAGQPEAYLAAQLAAWKGKARRNDPLGLMAGIATKLTDAEAAALSAYYASLPVPPTTREAAR